MDLKISYRKSKKDDKKAKKSGSSHVPIKRWVHRDAFDAMMSEIDQHQRYVSSLYSYPLIPFTSTLFELIRSSGNIELTNIVVTSDHVADNEELEEITEQNECHQTSEGV